MQIYYSIGLALEVPNELVKIDTMVEDIIWFNVQGVRYTARLNKAHTNIRKHSIRRDNA